PDAAWSLSGAVGFNLPFLLPFRSKTSSASILALEAYNRFVLGSITKSSKPYGRPHSGTDHLLRNLPLESNTCIRLLRGSATYTLLLVGSPATEVWSLN